MKKSVKLFITGNVQPIFFSQFIKDNAKELGVRGHVRALEDGRVEVFAEGDITAVDKMIEVCKKGQPSSQIRKVEEKEEKFQDFKEFKVFKI